MWRPSGSGAATQHIGAGGLPRERMLDHEPDGRRDVKALGAEDREPECFGVQDPYCFVRYLPPPTSQQCAAQNDPTRSSFPCSLQFGVFRSRLIDDWQVGVGIFPDREDILVDSLGFGRVA